MRKVLTILFISTLSLCANSQPDEDKFGAWYMYFWNVDFKKNNFGLQGDVQYRNWNLIGDLEQLLLRGGVTYKPENTDIKFTLGYAHIQTGVYGNDKTVHLEDRIYQEVLIPKQIGNRFYFNNRFRYEQRWVDDQNLRTRYRYNLFLNIALSKPVIEKGTFYLALYNEVFLNGQRNTGTGTVEIFDRNRSYGALGYAITTNLKVQAGVMHQYTDHWGKTQAQFSVHHKF